MTDWSYSNEALDVRNEFLGVKAIIYVEGDDDILFWQEIFSRVTDEEFEIESVGGSNELDEYIEKINSNQLNSIIAARDADFLSLFQKNNINPKVLHTYGYSIENSLYEQRAITQLARLWSKSQKITEAEIKTWLKEFSADISPLVHLDVANYLSKKGLETLGDNCSRYTVNNKSEKICKIKVQNAVKKIEPFIPPQYIALAEKEIGNTATKVITHIRGHFLATAAHRYIVQKAKSLDKKAAISAESLYAAAISVFTNMLNNLKHPHTNYYISSATEAWSALQKL